MDSHHDNLGRPPSNVEVGSGDFNSNPIYGDQPATISTYENRDHQFEPNEHHDDYQYPQHEQDDDINNPFNDDASAQAGGAPPGHPVDTMPQHRQHQHQHDQVPMDNRGPPPPYAEDPPSPPVAYQQQPVYGNGTHEPEDVVAQMNQQHPDVYRDEDPDYGITQPKTEDHIPVVEEDEGEGFFGNAFVRRVYMSAALLFVSMLSFSVWFSNLKDNWCILEGLDGADDNGVCSAYQTAYGLSGFGALMIFVASIGSLVFMMMKKFGRPVPAESISRYAIIGVYGTGSGFYLIGGCATAAAWNKINVSYIAGIFFAEQFFVGFHAACAAIDFWKETLLSSKKWRTLIYNGMFLFLGVVAFFAYAVTSTTFDDEGVDNAGPALVALFYFLILIPEIVYLVIFLVPKLNHRLARPIVLMILSGVFSLCCAMLLIGYFVITGNFFQNFTGKGYFVGMGFFVLLSGAVIASDMFLENFIPGYMPPHDGPINRNEMKQSGVHRTDSY